MEFSPNKYIDFVDQVLNLDVESKRKTTWIVVRILNILMTIELAIFLAERFGYGIRITAINLDIIILGFKNYDIIVGVTCFTLVYFGVRAVSWFAPNAMSYTRYWSTWGIDNAFKEKMNKNLDNPEEFERWKINFERRYKEAKVYTERFELSILLVGNLFLTYNFIVQKNLSLLYSTSVSILLFLAMIVIGFIYSMFKEELIWSLAFREYFENKKKFKIEEIRKFDRYGLKVLSGVVHILVIGTLLFILANFPNA